MRIIESDLIPNDGMIYVLPDLQWGRHWIKIEPKPKTPAEEAVAIVHAGLADEIDWLRANGHRITTWLHRREQSELRVEMHYWVSDLRALHTGSWKALTS